MAQSSDVLQAIESDFKNIIAKNQPIDLFLHTDKQVYTPNENIWFTAYILNPDSLTVQHTLHCLLVEEATKKMVAADRFVIDHGLAGGALFLNDSLRDGEYRLLAYTNTYLELPGQSIFQQPIVVKTALLPPFKLSFLTSSSNPVAGDSLTITYKVTTAYGGVASGGTLSYTLSADDVVLQTGVKTIDAFGEVRFMLSGQQVTGKPIGLRAVIERQKELAVVKTIVPPLQKIAFIRLFPEGGYLVQGSQNTMGLEIKDGDGTAIAVKGQLLENDQPVGDFSTDRQGLGVIQWTPHQHKKYTLQLEDTSWQLKYIFPAVTSLGYHLHVPEAVVKDSTILVEISVPAAGDTCHLVAHNYRDIFFSGTLRVKNRQAALRLPAGNMPEGVITLTLFEAAGNPYAERAVYIKKSQSLNVQMMTDSSVYHHRSGLKLKVKVTNDKGEPVQAFFSLACVLSSRLDAARMGDIVRFTAFDRFLPAMTNRPAGSYVNMPENIERLLLTRFWTRYRWLDFDAGKPYMPQEEKKCDAGIVYYDGRPVKQPVKLLLISNRQTRAFQTDSAGHFELSSLALRSDPDEKIMLVPAGDEGFDHYAVMLYNKCAETDSALSVAYYPRTTGLRHIELAAQEQKYLKTYLQPVVVSARKQDENIHVFKSIDCDDYVCMYNVLNCPNHPGGVRPVEGGEYYFKGRQKVIYNCGKMGNLQFLHQLNGVHYPKEFYVADYEKINPGEPEMMSTVFWSYKILTNENGEAMVSFFTNDLNGRFTCVLQGYTNKGPISAATSFRVFP